MTNLTLELIEKAKTAKTAEELQALAKENGVELTAEEAAACFAHLHPATGEISDDELDNVSGGGCYNDDRLVVTNFHSCELWACEKCGYGDYAWESTQDSDTDKVHRCNGSRRGVNCGTCKYMIYNGLQLCNHPNNRK